jgi:hypothetical protein
VDQDDQADEVRRRMSSLRSDLEGDVQNVTDSARAIAENARAMADWRYVVRRFPYATAGLAAAVGFLVVPKRSEVIVPDPETLAKMAQLNQVWVKTGKPQPIDKQAGWMAGLLALAASTAGRFALNWATAQVKTSLAASASRSPAPANEVDEPQPLTSKYPPR